MKKEVDRRPRGSKITGMSTATFAEVSRLAGCSVATVSRVINNNGPVSPQMREAILTALRETQYLAQRGAKRSRKPRGREMTGAVEIILHRHSPLEKLSLGGDRGLEVGPLKAGPDSPRAMSATYGLGQSFYRQILDGIVHELTDWGYRALIKLNADLLDPEFVADVNGPDRNGILLLGEYTPALARFAETCLHPLVLVDLIHRGSHDVVTIDNTAGITDAVEHLLELGHRDIGYVGKQEQDVAFAERFHAFQLRMVQAGLPIRPEWIYSDDSPSFIEQTAVGVKEILAQPKRPTALVCSNDCYALGVVRAAANMGISIPGELSVVGFDDVEFATMVTPPLTTVHVPLDEMGRQGVRELLIQIQAGVRPKRRGHHVRLLPELVVRHSTGPVPR
jgi:DNA-binding LacI/PurR family transcriptional regulator